MRAATRVFGVWVACIMGFSGNAAAQDKPVEWRFSEFSTAEYALTGSAAVGSILVEQLWPGLEDPHWIGPILFDDAVRRGLLAESESGLNTAAKLSDVLVLGLAFYPFADAVWAGGYVHHDSEVVGQMMLLNTQSLAVSTLVVGIGKRLIGRRRPGAGKCYDEPNHDPSCNERSTKSHPSGHANVAFTGAGLTCAHHLNMDLYGGGAADIAACAASLGLAAGVATLRIVANKHYFSDVFVGALIGASVGYLLPVLLHYNQVVDSPNASQQSQALQPKLINFGGSF